MKADEIRGGYQPNKSLNPNNPPKGGTGLHLPKISKVTTMPETIIEIFIPIYRNITRGKHKRRTVGREQHGEKAE